MKITRQGWIIACVLYCIFLLAISVSAYLKILPVQVTLILFYDTILHFVLLGVAGFLMHQALGRRMLKFYKFQIPSGPFIMIGLTLFDEEILQRALPNRSVSFSDLVASLLGIVFFYKLGEIWIHKKNKLE